MQTFTLKPLRISHHLSQEQLAQMSGLNVRTIQRIESGHKASVESMKCIASALDIETDNLIQEKVMIDKNAENWRTLPLFLRIWFVFNFLQLRPSRDSATRVEVIAHLFGSLFCCAGFVSEPALAGGLLLLGSAYFFHFLKWQGDKYGIWYDRQTN